MNRTARLTIVGGALVASAVLVGGGLAQASDDSGPEETDTAITGAALERASAAALAHTGEGTVTDTEVGDEESYYEVEVTLDNGDEVDVQLDESFTVVSTETDSPTDD